MFSFFSSKKAEEASQPSQPSQPPQPAPITPLAPPMKTLEVSTMPMGSQQTADPRRSVRQLGLFFAGATFLTMSTLITRRAVARRMNEALPKLFHPSHNSPRPKSKTQDGEGQLIAVQALGLATLNVFSFAIMATGGLAWAFDVSSVEDLRQRARKSLYGKQGRSDKAAEEEIEEWVASVLARKEDKDGATKSLKEGKDG